jgi:hypothetical protein
MQTAVLNLGKTRWTRKEVSEMTGIAIFRLQYALAKGAICVNRKYKGQHLKFSRAEIEEICDFFGIGVPKSIYLEQ